MFTYRCLECGKQHSNPDAFAEGYRAKCLRCSHAFEVTREMAQIVANGGATPPREQAITTAPRGQVHGVAVAAPAVAAESIQQAPTSKRPPATKKPAPPPDETASDAEAIDAADATPEELESLEQAALPPVEKKKKGDGAKKPATVALPKAGKKPWLKWAAIVAPVLLVCGAGGYYSFGRSKPKPAVAKAALKPKPTPKAAPTPKKVEEKKPAPPPAEVRPAIVFRVSAPRLAAEVASNAGEADRKYGNAGVEVSGLFDKLETLKQAKGPPALSALFSTERGRVVCDLSDALAPELTAWRALKPGKPFNVQGAYTAGGVLTKARLTRTRACADATFAGKPIELRGLVDVVLLPGPGVEFPTLRLEAGTGSIVSLHCLFKKEDVEQVKILKPGAAVTVEGDCAGRSLEGDKYVVRIDNCKFISTTGPAPSVPRLAPADLASEFEEDLRPYYSPRPAGKEPARPALTVTKLSKEWKADAKALEKYRHRPITVTGRLNKRAPGQLILESPETDQRLAVSCRFGRAFRDRISDLPAYTVTGTCTGMEGERTLRLDDCEVDASQLQADGPRLTAEYLPHKVGTTSTFDFVGFSGAGKKSAMINRQVWLRRENGVIETVVTHTGRFAGQSLFAPGHKENWTDGPRISKTRIPGPVYVWKSSPLTTELGQRITQPKGGVKVETKLVLKLGAKAGESWKWAGEDSKHVYTLTRFDNWRGKPSAVVKEVIVGSGPQGQNFEVEHVFARDLGEVERRGVAADHIDRDETALGGQNAPRRILAGQASYDGHRIVQVEGRSAQDGLPTVPDGPDNRTARSVGDRMPPQPLSQRQMVTCRTPRSRPGWVAGAE